MARRGITVQTALCLVLILTGKVCSEQCPPWLPGSSTPGPWHTFSCAAGQCPHLIYPTLDVISETCDYSITPVFMNTPGDGSWLLIPTTDFIDDAGLTWNGQAIRIVSGGTRSQFPVTFDNPYEDPTPNSISYTIHDKSDVTGIINGAEIHINNAGYIWWRNEDYEELLRDVLRHEYGHVLNFTEGIDGMSHVMSQQRYWGHTNVLSVEESDALAKFYPADSGLAYLFSPLNCCLRNAGPVILNRLWAERNADAAVLRFATALEMNIGSFIVGRIDSLPTPTYVVLDTLESGAAGGEYAYVDSGEHSANSLFEIAALDDERRVEGRWITSIDCAAGYKANVQAAGGLQRDAWGRGGGSWQLIAEGKKTPPTIADKLSLEASDYVVFAYSDFVEEIAPLCAFWESTGLDVAMWAVDDSANRQQIIKDLVAQYYAIRELQGVLLVGDACENNDIAPVNLPANPVSPPAINHIPAFYEESLCYPSIKKHVASDVPYGDVDDDGYIEVPIGRLPADNGGEVSWYVSKVLTYMSYGELPVEYNRTAIHCVPTLWARCELPGQRLGDESRAIKNTGMELLSLGRTVGEQFLQLYDTTDLAAWRADVNVLNGYQQAARKQIAGSLRDGAHVVIGIAEHFGSYVPYSLFGRTDWEGMTEPRGTMSFLFWYQCLAANYSGVNGLGEDYQPLCEHELFEGSALAVMGPNGPSWNALNSEFALNWVGAIFRRDQSGHYDGVPVGRKYMESLNALRDITMYKSTLRSYQYLGDPMLRVRDPAVVTDIGASTSEPSDGTSLYPNPCNARLIVRHEGEPWVGMACRVYSIRGEIVRTLAPSMGESVVEWKWDGQDENGRTVPSGTYIVRVVGDRREWQRKVLLLK